MKTKLEIIKRMDQLIEDIETYIETNDLCNEQVNFLHGITSGYYNLIAFAYDDIDTVLDLSFLERKGE